MGLDPPLRARWSWVGGLLLVLAVRTGEAFVTFTTGSSNAPASLRWIAKGSFGMDPRRAVRTAPSVLLASRNKAESVELEDGEEEGDTEGGTQAAVVGGEEELVEWVVSGSDGVMPLDVVLARRFPELSRRVCRKLLQADKVKVNGQVTRRFSKVGKGAYVSAYVPVQRQGSVPSLGFELKPEKMDLEVLYEDEHLLVVNKPPGVSVQPCESQPSGTLLHGVLHHLMFNNSAGGVGEWDGAGVVQGITHRLDKGTSGVWMYAKSRACGSVLSKTFEDRGVGKTYIVACHGNPGAERLVEAPIFRKSSNKMAVATNEEERRKAKPARSSVHTLLSDGSMSLARVRILTGRTHQIRVHMASLGCPALGDDVYCTSEFASLNRQYRKMGLKRVLLHALCVELLHPVTKEPLRFVAPLSKDMLATAKYIANLKEDTNQKRKERKQGILDALAAGKDAW